jgi:hypothetical protein
MASLWLDAVAADVDAARLERAVGLLRRREHGELRPGLQVGLAADLVAD